MNDGTYLPRGMFRSRALLDLAHGVDRCMNCGAISPAGMEPAHSNLQEHGRGKDNKGHDCFFAALCHTCHAWLDHGSAPKDPTGVYDCTREGKRELFIRAMHRTWLELWRLEKLRVA